MHILFVTNNYTPYKGGVVSSIDAFAQELRHQGNVVTIVTLDFTGQVSDADQSVMRLHCPIKFKYKKNHMALPLFIDRQLDQIIRSCNPDIVHVHHPFLLGPAAVKIAQRYTIPTLFTYHTMYESYTHYVPFVSQRVMRFLVRQRVASFCSSVDMVIAPSRPIADLVLQTGSTTPVAVLPSPIANYFFQIPPPGKVIVGNIVKLLIVSRLVPEKNIRFLLDLMNVLGPGYTLTLAGYGAEYEALQQYAYRVLNLSTDRVLFIHQPTKSDLVELYRSHDLFVFSSQTDTQALVLAEAMAFGLPVISLYGPGQSDIVMNGVNGYLVANLQEMSQKIDALVANSELYTVLTQGAYRTAQRYQAHGLVEKLLTLYKDLCCKSTTRS